MMFKKKPVVMLPTNGKAMLYTSDDKSYMDSKPVYVQKPNGFHLYFLSDEEIKEGDWFLHPTDNEILQCSKISNNFVWYKKFTVPGVSEVSQSFSIHVNLKPIKVIASTNLILGLSQPSLSFLQRFMKEYNKGNVITEVMIKYEDYWIKVAHSLDVGYRPKIDPKDNTITIKKVKDFWNREEMEAKLKLIVGEAISYPEHFVTGICLDNTKVQTWIDQNL